MTLSASSLFDKIRQFDGPVVKPSCRVLHIVSLAVAAAILAEVNRHQWFFGDEWDFLVRRGVLGGELGLFVPHNEHWSTIPILVYRALFSAFGVRTYAPYVAVLLLFHLVTTHLLWRVMRRSGVGEIVALAVAWWFALYGAGFENLLWAFQIGFIGSVALGLLALLLVNADHPTPGRDAMAVSVVTVSLAFSGVSLTMIVVVSLFVHLRRGFVAAARFIALPAAVYLLWYSVFGRFATAQAPITTDSLLALPAYVGRGLFYALEEPTGWRGSGPFLLLALACWVVASRELAGGRAAMVVSLAAGAAVLFVATGITRSSLGIEQANSSRYVYLAGALLLPALGLLLSDLARSRWLPTLFVVALVGFASANGLGILRSAARFEGDRDQALLRRALVSAQLARQGTVFVDDRLDAQFAPDLRIDDLDRLRRSGDLPTGNFTIEDQLGAEAALQLAIRPLGDRRLSNVEGRPRLSEAGGATVATSRADCFAVMPTSSTPQIVLDIDRPSSFSLTPMVEGSVVAFLRPPRPSAIVGPGRAFVVGRTEVRVSISASPSVLLLNLPTGVTSICGVDVAQNLIS